MLNNIFVDNSLFNKAKEKLAEISEDINENYTEIEEKLTLIGYQITTVEISITLPPRFSFEVDVIHSIIDQSVKDEFLKDAKPILKAIILGLDKAFDIEKTLTFKNKILTTVVIEGSFIPTIKLIYK